jgi:hypothetical protein
VRQIRVYTLWGGVGAEIRSVEREGDGARLPAAEKQGGQWRGGAEALRVAVRGGEEDSLYAGYGEEAVGDCEGLDLEADFGGEVWEVGERGGRGGHCVVRLRAGDGEELDVCFKSKIVLWGNISWCRDAAAYSPTALGRGET